MFVLLALRAQTVDRNHREISAESLVYERAAIACQTGRVSELRRDTLRYLQACMEVVVINEFRVAELQNVLMNAA